MITPLTFHLRTAHCLDTGRTGDPDKRENDGKAADPPTVAKIDVAVADGAEAILLEVVLPGSVKA